MTGLRPHGPLLAFYGDDFTGATAVMEVMAFAGLDAILFLDEPTPEQLAFCRHMRCIGIAGTARARSPEWMAGNLPRLFRRLGDTGAPLVHYKVCSTFDSAPHIGSIGAAIDIGAQIFGGDAVPVIVGAPTMGRYQAFGTLFAAIDGVTHRIDRHPVMSRHPVTPMDEADLLRHLARQTRRRIELVDLAALARGDGQAAFDRLCGDDTPAVFIDVAEAGSSAAAGGLIWHNRARGRFVAGSQGVEYALVDHWRQAGLISAAFAPPRPASLPQIAVVSGSCSPVTAAQIDHAEAHGFAGYRLNLARIADARAFVEDAHRTAADALRATGESGLSPLVYAARGPDDAATGLLRAATEQSGLAMAEANRRIGQALGLVLRHFLASGRFRRAVIAGGDTSGEAMSVLGVEALSALAPLTPGAPLCRALSRDAALAGLELSLKGGQMGGTDFFAMVRQGGPA